jgi:hypothetical protein
MLVDGACEAAGCDCPKLKPKPLVDVPFVTFADGFANGLFTGADGEKSNPTLPPLPNPPNDTFGEPFPLGGVPFVGGKLWEPLVKRPGCGVGDTPKLFVGRVAAAPAGRLPFAALILES